MRPKIVILVLVVTIGVVALAAVLKGVIGGHRNQDAKTTEAPLVEPGNTAATSPQVNPNASNNAAVLEELRAKELTTELDQVRELQAQGSADPATIGLLLTKVTHREPEVRKAALEALVQLNDTNAIPGLEQATGLIEDPREKVAFMDAVIYLKLPGVTDGAAPELADASNNPTPAMSPREVVPNPKFQPGAKKQGRRQSRQLPGTAQPAAPASPGQTQPASPAPDTAPPQ
jgi:hypothetical protein